MSARPVKNARDIPKNQTVLLYEHQALMVFSIFGCLFVKNMKNKVSACFSEITY
jgi:hypothetical protein